MCLGSQVYGGQIVTLGDSLTYAYESEFGVDVSVPFVFSFGDGMPDTVRNWVEILQEKRNGDFDQGERIKVNLLPPLVDDLFIRREANWALPGAEVETLRSFVMGEQTVTDLISDAGDFGAFGILLGLTDFEVADFSLDDFENQIENTADRFVLFVGGNDCRGIYRTVYEGGSAGSFVADFLADADEILSRVRELNATLPMVVVNVPHIGITPDIKTKVGTDPVKTARVTAVMEELNEGLLDLAKMHDAGYADVYTQTLSMLGPEPLCVYGLPFANEGPGDGSGDLDFVWLDGELSANFHPNTNGQALVANEIICAFNEKYGTEVAPLTATEILGDLLEKSAAEIDVSFSEWATCYGVADDADGDADGDGLTNYLEFAMGLHPGFADDEKVRAGVVEDGGVKFLEYVYPQRLATSAEYSLVAEWGNDLVNFSPVGSAPLTDGRVRARVPVVAGERRFLRVRAE